MDYENDKGLIHCVTVTGVSRLSKRVGCENKVTVTGQVGRAGFIGHRKIDGFLDTFGPIRRGEVSRNRSVTKPSFVDLGTGVEPLLPACKEGYATVSYLAVGSNSMYCVWLSLWRSVEDAMKFVINASTTGFLFSSLPPT